MSNIIKLLPVNLQLFAEGAASGAAEGGESGQAGSQGEGSQAEGMLATSKSQAEEVTPEERLANYQKFCKDYKDLQEADFQKRLNKRLKGSKANADKLSAQAPIMKFLADKYGVDVNNVGALSDALMNDDAFYEKIALESGKPVELVKAEEKIARIERQRQEDAEYQEGMARYNSWISQAEQAKMMYPSFDLETELQTKEFADMLYCNVPVIAAYQALHMDEIIPAAMQVTAKEVAKRQANNVMAKGTRPVENGVGAQAPSVSKIDVNKLTDTQIDDLIRRASRGEKIVF